MIRINLMTQKLRNVLNNRRWRATHHDKYLERNRLRYYANVEYFRKWRVLNRNKVRNSRRKYWAAHLDKVTELVRVWRKEHPEKVKSYNHHRRSKEHNSGSWMAQEWTTLRKQYQYRCVGCWLTEGELKALGRKLVPDHIVSLSKGGLNHITNLQPLCHGIGGCNNKKGTKYIDFCIS